MARWVDDHGTRRRASRTVDVEREEIRTRVRCLHDLHADDMLTQGPVYPRLSGADKAKARDLVLRALDWTGTGRRGEAIYVICRSMGPDLHDEADRIGAHLHTAADAELRSLLASALVATRNEEAMRRHQSKALVAEPVRRNRLRHATLLWWHDLGPVEARLLTRRAGGKPPATESEAVEEPTKERAAGSQEAADALCLSGHLDLLSAEQKADLAGRLGAGQTAGRPGSPAAPHARASLQEHSPTCARPRIGWCWCPCGCSPHGNSGRAS
ncbi:MAG TPA: hypothetical protein PLD23_06600 [Armatimonadota bacterium]|nr:hypothetical protein [Armatimonadota bacterium]